jgi:hypothetical protein
VRLCHTVFGGNYFEYPKGERKRGMVDKIRRRLRERFPECEFTVQLKGWGERRGHVLFGVSWPITVFKISGRQYPSEQAVRYLLDSLGEVAGTSNVVFDLKPTFLPPIEGPFEDLYAPQESFVEPEHT